MKKLVLDLDGLAVESFEAGEATDAGTVIAHGGSCSMQRTCGAASRGEETFVEEIFTRYACCV